MKMIIVNDYYVTLDIVSSNHISINIVTPWGGLHVTVLCLYVPPQTVTLLHQTEINVINSLGWLYTVDSS